MAPIEKVIYLTNVENYWDVWASFIAVQAKYAAAVYVHETSLIEKINAWSQID